jgi:DNA repair exonuclease SbcCD ATPase subunit
MTSQQVNLISNMIRSHSCRNQPAAAFHEARKELLASCEEQKSDAAAPQPSVTVTATSSQSEPVPPSTPKPLGSEWWKDRRIEALQEQIVIIADQRETIVELKKRIEYGDKHNNELVAANAEIYQSLRHWGLEQTEPCSLVNNVKQVIQLCAERGKEIVDLNERYNLLEKRAEQRAGEAKMRSDMIDLMEKQADQKDKKIDDLQKVIDVMAKQQPSDDRGTLRAIISQLKSEKELLCEGLKRKISEIKSLKEVITSQDGKIASLKESVDNRTKMIEALKKEIEALKKDLAEANTNTVIKELKDICDNRQGFIDKSIDIIDNLRKQLGDKSSKIDILKKEIDILGKQIENMKGYTKDDRDILYKKILEIEVLKKQAAVLVKNQQTIINVGSKVAERLNLISGEFYLTTDELVKSQQVIKLWNETITL